MKGNQGPKGKNETKMKAHKVKIFENEAGPGAVKFFI